MSNIDGIAGEDLGFLKDIDLNSFDLEGATELEAFKKSKAETPPAKDDKKAPIAESSIPVTEARQAIPNTYRDLLDSSNSWSSIEEEDKEAFMVRELNQLLSLPHRIDYPENIDAIMNALEQGEPVPASIGHSTEQLKLSFYINKMPHGIVDKQVAGIGATTLEIDSKRNSIIVFPTKVLAYNKWLTCKKRALYIGGKINEERDTTSQTEFGEYMKNKEIIHRKFLVVADSLTSFLRIIGKAHYKDYFLMIDEVDMIQSEGNYRPRLETLIDHYFEFPPKNRCLVTATMREFSNPRLQQECKFKLTWKDVPKRNIQLYHTDNLDALTAQQIQAIPQTEKVVIAFNSIRHCKNIIKLLPEQIQRDCAILCSDSSKEEAGDYYAELTQENKLPQRVNFITSCYFAGVDIEDKYHLITVSNARQNYQMLSLDKMTQIHGRCRLSEGILSDTIIYNKLGKWQINTDTNYQNTLLKQASALLQLQKTAKELIENDKDLEDLFEVVKTAIREKGAVCISGEQPIRLTRKDNYKAEIVAYMNIDYLVEREKLRNSIYNTYNQLETALKEQGHTVRFENRYGTIPQSENQIEIEASSKNKLQATIDGQLRELIEELREITKSRHITGGEKQQFQAKKGCSAFVSRFYLLQEYADAETLLNQLWEIRHNDRRAYKNLQNAATFWALDDKHPFKRDLFRAFEIGKKYKAKEIEEAMLPLVKYHLHKTIKGRAAVSLLKALFLVERPKIYLIKSKNPIGFKKPGSLRIPKTEENLLKYFQLS